MIGRGGALPWRMPSDLKHFRAVTMGKPVIMGRKTFKSIGRPLPGRTNIVVTRDSAFQADGVHTVPSFDAALDLARKIAVETGASEIVVAGGAEIYAQAMPRAHRIRLNRIETEVEGDAYFQAPDPDIWEEVSHSPLQRGQGDEHEATAIIYQRRRT